DEKLEIACDRLQKYILNNSAIYDNLNGTLFTPENTNSLCQKIENKLELTDMGYLLCSCLLRTKIGVSCFSISDPNPLLFSQYSDMHKGVCLEYEIDNTNSVYEVEYNATVKHLTFSDIVLNFIDDQNQINPNNKFYKPFLIK